MLIFPHRLTGTGKDPVPLQIFEGHISCCENLHTTQEEADNIIIHHVVASAPTKAIVIAENTSIFVLLLHFTFTGDIKPQVYIQPTDEESSAIVMDIAATYQRHIKITPNIFAAHGLSGCDTVC